MAFDVEGARKAGYSDQEIADHLAKQSGFDAGGARKAGYSDGEILAHMQGKASSPAAEDAPQDDRSSVRSYAEGALRSAAGFGNTLLTPVRAAADFLAPQETTVSTLVDGKKRRTGALAPVAEYLDRIPEAMKWLDSENASNPVAYGAGRLTGDIAMTAPIGGVVGAGIKTAGARAGLPLLEKLGTAVSTGGLRTGAPVAATLGGKTADMALRMTGGAINGGVSAGALDPESAGTGAMIGAALPPVAGAALGAGRLVQDGVRKVGQALAPLNPKNDPQILSKFLTDNIGPKADEARAALRKYQQTGPALPGYQPSVAEVTRVPSLAAIERTATAVNPLAMNANATRMARNQEALGNTLDDLAGRDGARMFADILRETAANQQYGQAFAKGVDQSALTRPLQRQIDTLMQKPAMQAAMQRAQELARNEGIDITDAAGSVRGMHYAKGELDAMIRDAATQNEKRILMGVKNDLVGVIDKLSPDYGTARATYESMSRPVNQFEVLEQVASRSRTPRGNVTLNNFNRAATDKTAAATLRRPGLTMQDLLTAEQLSKLGGVRSTLEGIDFAQTAGRGVGSDTVQKLATAGRLPGNSMSPLLSRIPGSGLVGGLVGKGVDALYSGANQRLQEKLTRGLLDPAEGLGLLEFAAQQQAAPSMGLLASPAAQRAVPLAYRTAPVLMSQ